MRGVETIMHYSIFGTILIMSASLTMHAEESTKWHLWDTKETVEEYCKHEKISSSRILDLGDGVKLALVLIPAGTFIMGKDKEGTSDSPAHQVTISRPFYFDKFAITQEQYEKIMGKNPSRFRGKTLPVEQVSWEEAAAFCKKAGELSKEKVRLPTEAEWEYSCRAGTSTLYHSGNTTESLTKVSWFNDNSNETTHPVGQKEPNRFGLYDITGNVFGWCADWYGREYYNKSPAVDPCGPETGYTRTARGGDWSSQKLFCTSNMRFFGSPDIPDSSGSIGFRIAIEFPKRTNE